MHGEALSYSLHSLPPLKAHSFADVLHLLREEGNIEIRPRKESIELKIVEQNILKSALLSLEFLQL